MPSTRRIVILGLSGIVAGALVTVLVLLKSEFQPANSIVTTQPVSNPSQALMPPVNQEQASQQPQPRAAIFSTDFTHAVPSQFSHGGISVTKKGKRKFLGPFGPEGVTFKLTDLPAHQLAHVSFDLVLIKSWNGCSPIWGPDVWTASLEDGVILVRTTFGNCGFFSDNNEQNYPDMFPTPAGADPHPAWTGAVESQTLGYTQSWGGPERTFDCSSIYHMDWVFPHTGSSLGLVFGSQPRKRDKVFGLMSFSVETVDGPVHLTEGDLKQAWIDLSGDDAVAANLAVWELISAGEQAVDFLQGQPIMPSPTTTAPVNAYRTSRLRHVLQVIHSPAAIELLGMLPAEDPEPPLPAPR